MPPTQNKLALHTWTLDTTPLAELLDIARSTGSMVGRRVRRHHLVANRLDDLSALFLARGGHDLETALHDGARLRVTQRFIKPGAAAYVGKHDREIVALLIHASMTQWTKRQSIRQDASLRRGQASRGQGERGLPGAAPAAVRGHPDAGGGGVERRRAALHPAPA